MCGILGVWNHKSAFKMVLSGLESTKNRGNDAFGYFDGEKIEQKKELDSLKPSNSTNIMAHALHAIVNQVPQPLQNQKSTFVANCEIYNWQKLAIKHQVDAKNDADLLHALIDKIGMDETLGQIQGVYAFIHWKENTVTIARDIIGIKPLWYSYDGNIFACSSEKKNLMELNNPRELNPRDIISFDTSTHKISISKRIFFDQEEFDISESEAVSLLQEKLQNAIEIRIPSTKFGLLLSGGIDSVILAKILKDLGAEFICYVAATNESSDDLLWAKEVANTLDLQLKTCIVNSETILESLPHIIPLIEDSSYVKASVAVPLFHAAKQAQQDGNRVIISGSGADELFAGYSRYKTQDLSKLNKDLYSDILKFYEKNSYRDDVVMMDNKLELRVPYLDKELVSYALALPADLKIKQQQNEIEDKFILRQLARALNIPEHICARKKKAAQYGSGFDKAFGHLAKQHNFPSKSQFINSFAKFPSLKLAIMLSTGKDSLLAAHIMVQQNYELTCAINMRSKNKSSYMFHTPNINLAGLQAECLNIPLLQQITEGDKEKELEDLEKALINAKELHQIEGIITGALYSNYQRERFEKIADKLGLKIFSPLWHIDQEYEVKELLRLGFDVIISHVAAEGLNETWIGARLDEKRLAELVKLNETIGINIAGEGGEYESLVLDCPLFKKKIVIDEKATLSESENQATLQVSKAHTEEK